MKTYLLAIFILAAIIPQALLAQKKNEVLFEGIEWTNIWIPSADKNDLPRVLLIGNSITQGYYPVVESGLKGKAYIARYTTSRGIIDPVLFSEIKNLIKQHKYAVIHFNNGLHGIEYDAVQYEKGMMKLIRLLKKHGQGAELIGATSTPVLPGFPHWKSDEYNQNLITTRNRIMMEVCRKNNITVNDLYPLTHSKPELFSNNMIHYTAKGYKVLGEQAHKHIISKLNQLLALAVPDYFSEYRQSNIDFYKNPFDQETGLIRPGKEDGSFIEDFDPMRPWNGFQEENAFKYTWYLKWARSQINPGALKHRPLQ